MIFRIVDKADNVVPILTGFVFLMEIDFAAVINGRPVSIRDDFDKGMFSVGRIGGRFKTTANSFVSSRTRLPIGTMPTQVINSFIKVSVEGFPGLPEHEP